MTTKEFSDAFDVLLNSYSINMGFETSASIGGIVLDEYEKSIFLTQAQEQIVIELYTGRNDKGSSFENTEELRSSLKSLIKTKTLIESTDSFKGISEYSKFFVLPDDVLFITYEAATISDENAKYKNNTTILVVPVTQDKFDRVLNNPFKGPSDKRALRLDNGLTIAEIVTKYNIKDYTIRYLSKPTPIILADLDGVSINEKNTITECKLDSAMHRYILERAVLLAVSSRSIQNKSNV